MSDPTSSPGGPQDPYGQPTQPYGQQPSYPQQSYQQGYPQQQGYPPQGYAQPGYPAYAGQTDPDKRPGGVTTACVLAIVMSAVMLLAGIFLAAVGAVGSDDFTDSFRDSAGSSYDDFSDSDINNIVLGFGVGLVVWCLAAIVLAIFALRRSKVARVLLVISAAMSALLSLIGILSIFAIVPLIASIVTIVLLFVGGANAWYARRGAAPVPAQAW